MPCAITELLLVIKHVDDKVRVRHSCLKRSDDIVELRLGSSGRDRDNEISRSSNTLQIRVNIGPINSPSKTFTRYFRTGVHVFLRFDNQLIRSVNTPSSRLTFREILQIEGLFEHDSIECQIGIHDWILLLLVAGMNSAYLLRDLAEVMMVEVPSLVI